MTSRAESTSPNNRAARRSRSRRLKKASNWVATTPLAVASTAPVTTAASAWECGLRSGIPNGMDAPSPKTV